MESGNGSQELTRIATAYTTSIAFVVTFLTATAALGAGRLLAAPVVDVVLAAMARDEAKRQAEEPKEEEA